MNSKLLNEKPVASIHAFTATLLFLFGVSQFFVKWEPGPTEVLTLLLLPFAVSRVFLHPIFLLLLASALHALLLEFILLGTSRWSLISIYLVVQCALIVSIYQRFGRPSLDWIIFGAGVGAAVTLIAGIMPLELDLYRHGIRFTGFFKDPNVTAPTALFFAVTALGLTKRRKWIAIFPFIIFVMAISRATILAGLVATAILVSFRKPLSLLVSLPVSILLIANFGKVSALLDKLMQSIGRGGLVNSYDNDRASNWTSLLDRLVTLGHPLGPGYSELNGFSAHSLYLRLLVEQGWYILLIFVVLLVFVFLKTRDRLFRFGLLMLIVNSVVVDSTHWRVLFLAIGFCLALTQTTNMKPRGRYELAPEPSSYFLNKFH